MAAAAGGGVVDPLSPSNMYVVMVSLLAGTVLIEMRNITINHELCMDLWLCVGVFGPLSLHWLPLPFWASW